MNNHCEQSLDNTKLEAEIKEEILKIEELLKESQKEKRKEKY